MGTAQTVDGGNVEHVGSVLDVAWIRLEWPPQGKYQLRYRVVQQR